MKRSLCVLLLALLSRAPSAQESLVLTTPLPAVTTVRVEYLSLYMAGPQSSDCVIEIRVVPDSGTGPVVRKNYAGFDACNQIRFLNTANMSVQSLHRRVLNQLVKDGVLSGTVQGTPQPVQPAPAPAK